MVTETCSEAARHLLAQANAELAQGDLRRASEKGWGAAAQMVKALAERRGWEHRTHAGLFRVISDLATGTNDDEIRNLFHVANSMHINFYEDWNTVDNVQSGLSDVGRLLEKLGSLPS